MPKRNPFHAQYLRRECPVCGVTIPNAAGTFYMTYRVLVCHGKCVEQIDEFSRDYTNSKRGKLRPVAEVTRRILALQEKRANAHS